MTDLIADESAFNLSTVLGFIDSPATRREVEEAVLRARERRLDQAMDAEITAARFTPSEAVAAWIAEKERSGNSAKRNYPREIAAWAAFLDGGAAAVGANSSGGTDHSQLDDSRRALLAAVREDAVRYRDYLKESRKPNGVRTVMSILGSFYSYLERNHYIDGSPFSGLPRPRRESRVHVRTTEGQVPIMSQDEVHLVLEAAAVHSGRVGPALGLMAVFGIRVGSVVNVQAGSDYIAFRTKGGSTQRVLFRDLKAAPRDPQAVAALIQGRPFAGWTGGACRVACTRVLSSLYQGGALSNDFSPHDLRHAMAIREYKEDKDLLRVMRLLGHSSVATTQTYLEGMCG